MKTLTVVQTGQAGKSDTIKNLVSFERCNALKASVPVCQGCCLMPDQSFAKAFVILGASITFSCACVSHASVIFSQDFSGSSTLSAYVSPTPSSGQWNDLTTAGSGVSVGIVNGALQYDRTGNNTGSFTRSTDFSPAPAAIIYSFDLTVSSIKSAASSVATWYLGSGFSSGASAPSSAAYNSRFAVSFNTDDNFCLHVVGGKSSSEFASGNPISLTWVVNDTGSSLSYHGPNGTTDTVGNGKWDLYAGNTLIFDEQPADGSSTSLSELKFLFTADTGDGYGAISMDNFEIQSIPEPPEWAAVFALGGLLVCGLHEWQQHGAADREKDLKIKLKKTPPLPFSERP
jgi:hypothetical protein